MVLFQTILAQKITRIDVIGSPLEPAHKLVYTASSFEAQSPSTQMKRISIAEPFAITMNCDSSIGQTLCDSARLALVNAGKRIGRVLEIQQPINVNFTFRPFCPPGRKTVSACAQAATLGAARTTSFIVANVNDQFVSYPQAMIKNMIPDRKLPLSDFDIMGGDTKLILEFNADVNWWFPSQGGNPTVDQFDFEFVAAHELTHGLGFASGLIYPYGLDPSIALPNYLTPLYYIPSEEVESVNLIQPITAFDYVTVGKTGAWKDFGKVFESFNMRPVSSDRAFFQKLEGDSEVLRVAKQAYEAATAGDRTLQLGNGDGAISLFAPAKYLLGSSVSHCAISYNTTQDFLMTYAVAPSFRLDSLISASGGTEIYGPRIAAAMIAMGWAQANTTLKPIRIATDFQTKARTRNSQATYGMTAFVLLLAVL